MRGPALASVRVSLLLTGVAMLVIVAVGTPVAAYIARCSTGERLCWQAILLVPILLPPLALGILLTLAFGPYGAAGAALEHVGLRMTNSAPAFIMTQVYVGMGYYVLGAVAAFDAVPALLQEYFCASRCRFLAWGWRWRSASRGCAPSVNSAPWWLRLTILPACRCN